MATDNMEGGGNAAPSVLKRKRVRILTADRRKQNRDAQRKYRNRRKDVQTEVSTRKDGIVGSGLPEGLFSSASVNLDGSTFSDGGVISGLDCQSADLLSCFDHPVLDSYAGFDPNLESWVLPDAYPTPTESDLSDHYRAVQLPRLPAPTSGLIQLQKLGFGEARVQNALHIGLPMFLASREDAISPWYWHTQYLLVYSNDRTVDPHISCTIPRPTRNAVCFALNNGTSSDLAPTMLQSSYPHSMYLDMIPFPTFRDRVITLLSMDPPAFDEAELRRDIEEDGLVVWSTGNANSDGGAALVRDRRNWEASKSFLKKWKLLVHQSGLDEQSDWWQRMRGED